MVFKVLCKLNFVKFHTISFTLYIGHQLNSTQTAFVVLPPFIYIYFIIRRVGCKEEPWLGVGKTDLDPVMGSIWQGPQHSTSSWQLPPAGKWADPLDKRNDNFFYVSILTPWIKEMTCCAYDLIRVLSLKPSRPLHLGEEIFPIRKTHMGRSWRWPTSSNQQETEVVQ